MKVQAMQVSQGRKSTKPEAGPCGISKEQRGGQYGKSQKHKARILAEEFREDLGFLGHEELSYFEFGGSHEEF